MPHGALQWHAFALKNHWVSEQSSYHTGDPQYAEDSDSRVYLAGSLAGGKATDEAFQLPAAARPAHDLYLVVYEFDESVGAIEIDTDGKAYLYGSDATDYTSLAGISFPSAKSTGITSKTLSLANHWKSANPAYGTGNPTVELDSDGMVTLHGSMMNGKDSVTAFTLPANDRPSHVVNEQVDTADEVVGSIYIVPGGQADVYGPDASGLTSLAGVGYAAAKGTKFTWHTPGLHNGWKYVKTYNTGEPQYESHDGIVCLQGSMSDGNTDNYAFTLPTADRPAHELYLAVWTLSGVDGDLYVDPSGGVQAYGGNASQQVSLDGVCFPAGE